MGANSGESDQKPLGAVSKDQQTERGKQITPGKVDRDTVNKIIEKLKKRGSNDSADSGQ